MLDTKLQDPASDEEAAVAVADGQERPEDELVDEELADQELADEVIVEISVDGMCGVY